MIAWLYYLITLTSFAKRYERLQGSQESDWWISLDIFPENTDPMQCSTHHQGPLTQVFG